MPKVPTTPFRDQVVSLRVLPSEEADPAQALLVPSEHRHATLTGREASGPQTSSCLLRRPAERECRLQAENGPLDSGCHYPGLSGTGCALPVQVESPPYKKCGVLLGAGSWHLADRYCRAAGWATLNTFARFYSLCVEPVSSCVLTSNG